MRIEFWNGTEQHLWAECDTKEDMEAVVNDIWSQNENIVLHDKSLPITGTMRIK